MKTLFILGVILFAYPFNDLSAQNITTPLRIIAFGAHPDDAELKAGGVAAKWAEQGHKVKFVAMTNGDVGHFKEAGGPLAIRRFAEVQECAKLLGIETEVLDIHDGELMPTLENRKTVARLIREWQADIVLFHRPYDYHPDHRYTGVLVQDASVVVAAPFFMPLTPPTEHNPIFMYYSDNFERPYPSVPSIAVGIDEVAEEKWNCLRAMPSQMSDADSWQGRYLPNVPNNDQQRQEYIVGVHKKSNSDRADKYRERLVELYGQDRGNEIKYAEVFELCQYGRQASMEELKKLFLIDISTINEPSKVSPSQDGSLQLSAQFGKGVGPKIAYMPEESSFGWFTAADLVEWEVQVEQPGKYEVYLEWSVADAESGKPYMLKAGNQELHGKVEKTGSWQTFKTKKIGTIKLDAGIQKLIFKPTLKFETVGDKGALLDFRKLTLVPVKK